MKWMLGAAVTLLAACGGGPPEVQDIRPNLVMILADDIGYSDVGAYGGEIETPALDRLAENGLRFTRYYTNNMCVPTRAALLTGVYHTLALDESNTLRREAVTVTEALRQAGYLTYMAGKWHLSRPEDTEGLPVQRGFGQFFGTIHGAGSYFAPASLMRNNDGAEGEFARGDFYYTDAISDSAAAFIREAAGTKKAFFVYVAYTAAHWPLHALEEDVAKYRGRYAKGWDALRRERHERMKALGVVNPDWSLSPRHPDVPAWERAPHKEWQQRRMEVYAAQIDRMDRGIGRIVRALEETGKLENTLIVFQSDNGGCHVEYAPDRQGPYLPERTRDGRPVRPGNLPAVMPGGEDTYQSYGYGWANASNTPFRLFKQFDHEGGIRTPLIAHWPAKIKSGGITDQVAHVTDLAPTFLDVAKARQPRTYQGRRVLEMDGTTLMPVFEGERRRGHGALFFKWARGRAVRREQWKLVSADGGAWELYDIEADGTELKNLAKERPFEAQQLEALWKAWDALTVEQRLR
jgi:arylsulfatase A-like enzyme